jgi:hypothetical protein
VKAPVNPLVFLYRFLLGVIASIYYVLVPIYMWLKDQIVPKGQPLWKSSYLLSSDDQKEVRPLLLSPRRATLLEIQKIFKSPGKRKKKSYYCISLFFLLEALRVQTDFVESARGFAREHFYYICV